MHLSIVGTVFRYSLRFSVGQFFFVASSTSILLVAWIRYLWISPRVSFFDWTETKFLWNCYRFSIRVIVSLSLCPPLSCRSAWFRRETLASTGADPQLTIELSRRLDTIPRHHPLERLCQVSLSPRPNHRRSSFLLCSVPVTRTATPKAGNCLTLAIRRK